jgi:hypothetical protein
VAKVDYKSYLLDFKSLTEDDTSTLERTRSNPVELSSSLDEKRILQSPQVRYQVLSHLRSDTTGYSFRFVPFQCVPALVAVSL